MKLYIKSKHCDHTITNEQLEESSSRALINAIILNEYSHIKKQMSDEMIQKIALMSRPNEKLIKARSEKIDRRREYLPTILF